jgi:predicted ATPase
VLRLALEIDKEAGDVGLAFRTGPRLTHVLDVGSGVSQTLPVLVRLAEVALGWANGRIVAIEQPEAHLHADAEAKLAEVIVASISAQREARERPSLLLETHSENLFLSLQLAVLEERLSSDDIVVYWISQADDGSVAPTRYAIDARGVVTPPWPPGVFSEDMALARRILEARRRVRPKST